VPIQRAIYLYDRPGASQSTLQLGCRVERVTAETLPAFDLLEAVATEKAWELRENWGATYGLRANVQDFPGGVAHFTLEGAVETAKTGVALEKLVSVVTTLATTGPDIKTFTLKRWDLAREYDRNFATTAAIASALLRSDRNGWPTDTWDRYPDRLADTSRADVRATLGPCTGHEVITIVGDVKLVGPQLEAQGLAAWIIPAR
jgi:hypothetical protein